MRLGAFPVMPQTALIIGVVAYLAMGRRGVVAAGLLAGFNMIRTDGSAGEEGSGPPARRGQKLGQTISDFPDPPNQG